VRSGEAKDVPGKQAPVAHDHVVRQLNSLPERPEDTNSVRRRDAGFLHEACKTQRSAFTEHGDYTQHIIVAFDHPAEYSMAPARAPPILWRVRESPMPNSAIG